MIPATIVPRPLDIGSFKIHMSQVKSNFENDESCQLASVSSLLSQGLQNCCVVNKGGTPDFSSGVLGLLPKVGFVGAHEREIGVSKQSNVCQRFIVSGFESLTNESQNTFSTSVFHNLVCNFCSVLSLFSFF